MTSCRGVLEAKFLSSTTPPKFNMEPEYNGFQMAFPSPGTYFQVPCQVSGGVFTHQSNPCLKRDVIFNPMLVVSFHPAQIIKQTHLFEVFVFVWMFHSSFRVWNLQRPCLKRNRWTLGFACIWCLEKVQTKISSPVVVKNCDDSWYLSW